MKSKDYCVKYSYHVCEYLQKKKKKKKKKRKKDYCNDMYIILCVNSVVHELLLFNHSHLAVLSAILIIVSMAFLLWFLPNQCLTGPYIKTLQQTPLSQPLLVYSLHSIYIYIIYIYIYILYTHTHTHTHREEEGDYNTEIKVACCCDNQGILHFEDSQPYKWNKKVVQKETLNIKH